MTFTWTEAWDEVITRIEDDRHHFPTGPATGICSHLIFMRDEKKISLLLYNRMAVTFEDTFDSDHAANDEVKHYDPWYWPRDDFDSRLNAAQYMIENYPHNKDLI